MRQIKACGILIFREEPEHSFLLMRHSWRWDLPKGHVDEGEDELTCALREMTEETGIPREAIQVDPQFRFETHYAVQPPYLDGETVDKTYVIFLGTLTKDVPITVTEHEGYQWFAWNPPHDVQPFLLNPLLDAVAQYRAGS